MSACPLFGRDEVVGRLLVACARARVGHGGIVLLTGEIGIGKSSVAENVATMARADGTGAVFASYATTARRSPAPAPDRLAADAIDASTPTVLVLDDLHDADVPSLERLRPLLAHVDRSRLLLVATIDDGALGAARAVESAADGPTTAIALGGLATADLARLGERVVGEPIPEATTSLLAARTRGNPLFVTELLLHLRGRVSLDRADAVAEALAAWRRVEDVVAFRAAGLGIACRRLLLEAARMGDSIDLRALRAALALDAETFIDLVDEAQREAFLRPSAWDPDRYRFSHPIHRRVAGGVEPLRVGRVRSKATDEPLP